MITKALSALCLVVCLTAGAVAEPHNATLVSIRTPRGAKQAFILIRPEKPVASVILFAGGHGALGLRSASSMRWGKGNFLVRTRDLFADHGFDGGRRRRPVRRAGRHERHLPHEPVARGRHRRRRRLSEDSRRRSGLAGRHQHGNVLRGWRRDRRAQRGWLGAHLDHHRRQAELEDCAKPPQRRGQHGAAADHAADADRLASQGRVRHHAGLRRLQAQGAT